MASLASGSAFDATLKQLVREWANNRSSLTLAQMKGLSLFLPFVGIAGGACVFLASGVEIFGFPRWISYGLSVPMTLGIGRLVWTQLNSTLVQLEQGGSQALDLDSIR
ncbi:hypothetical protein [Neosynechococcus sphagnicola]|uniref:hypothetical protein n=1 Tax=Neosynechococcus sphagnicola TaxID=1501145 RepID=UPI001EFA065C|nr:hypothetical protein [Neosynechococcus sphagnicola]